MAKKYPKTHQEWKDMPAEFKKDELLIGGWQVMQDWEMPLMRAMANEVTASHGDILEIGFGMGISANEIIRQECKSYTVIEAHPEVADFARGWAREQKTDITVIEGFWEDVVPSMKKQFDGVLFDTYPLSEDERHKNHYPFIPIAPKLLKRSGVLTYYSDETIHFRPEHLTLLLTYFNEIKLIKVEGLEPPANCEYWSESYMIMPVAKKLDG